MTIRFTAITRTLGLCFAIAVLPWFGAHAQEISARQYLETCLAHVETWEEIPARIACQSALQLNPDLDEASRTIAYLDIVAGDLRSAFDRLTALQAKRPSSENLVLLAEIAIERNQPVLVEQYINRIANLPPPKDPLAVPFIEVRLQILRGEYPAGMLNSLHEFTLTGRATVQMVLTEIELLLRMRYFSEARLHLSELPRLTVPAQAALAGLYSARLAWATGDIQGAKAQYEAVLAEPTTTVLPGVFTVEHEYAAMLLALGDIGGAYQRWLSADSGVPGRWWLHPTMITWFALTFFLVALFIIAESNVPQTFGRFDPINRQIFWSVGGSLAILFGSALLATISLLVFSHVFFGHWMAFLAPPNFLLFRMAFLTTLSFISGTTALVLLQRYTRSAAHELRGTRIHIGSILWGGLFVAAAIALWHIVGVQHFGGTTIMIDMFAPPLMLLAFVVAVPYGEIFYRAFMVPTFELRYTGIMPHMLSVMLFAFILGAPVVLLLILGGFFTWIYTRYRSGTTVMLMVSFGLALLFATGYFVPLFRTFFF